MSESKLKTISINPDIFAGFGGGSNTRKKKPEKPLKIKAPVHKSDKTRKKEILQRIRANQEKQYKTLFDEKEKKPETVETSFNNEFDESVKFMESVVENTEKANLNRTLKNQAPMMGGQSLLFHPDPTLSTISEPLNNIIDTIGSSFGPSFNEPITPFKISPPPQYGCLRWYDADISKLYYESGISSNAYTTKLYVRAYATNTNAYAYATNTNTYAYAYATNTI